jgi:pyruvate dehydrogenase E2 component (dihydrolipoamide acetyltransferase)
VLRTVIRWAATKFALQVLALSRRAGIVQVNFMPIDIQSPYAARRSLGAVSADVTDLAERARLGKLAQREIQGGSFCISNLGMYRTEEFSAIINPPQSSILAVGAALREPVVQDGEPAIATVMRVTLSVDHRAIDGSIAAAWLRTFADMVENPL